MHINLNELIVIDCEASGLDEESYPIEVGVAMHNDNIEYLIKPISEWTYWSIKSEAIHNIKRSTLFADGFDVVFVANILNSQLRGLSIISDSEVYESFWLDKLFRAAKMERNFKIININNLDFDFEKYKEKKLQLSKIIPIHRALNDAIIIRESLIFAAS